MSELGNFKFERLRKDDESTVCRWLEGHLLEHMTWWSKQIGPVWTPDHIREHLREHQLIQKEWEEIQVDSTKEDRFVTIVREEEQRCVGVVWGSVRTDRYFRHPRGELNWVCVDPDQRRRGIGMLLMDWADLWFKRKGVRSRELFATAANRSAIELYKKRGYQTVDVRMLRGF